MEARREPLAIFKLFIINTIDGPHHTSAPGSRLLSERWRPRQTTKFAKVAESSVPFTRESRPTRLWERSLSMEASETLVTERDLAGEFVS